MDNPFQEGSRSFRLFEVLAESDRPLRPRELAGAVGLEDATVAHSMLKDLRSRGVRVYRYRDPDAGPGAESLYGLHPVEGLLDATSSSPGRPRRAIATGPPPPCALRSVSRWWAHRRVSPACSWTVTSRQPLRVRRCRLPGHGGRTAARTEGEWMTVVTVGLHGRGLYVDLAGARQITIENITEDTDGVG